MLPLALAFQVEHPLHWEIVTNMLTTWLQSEALTAMTTNQAASVAPAREKKGTRRGLVRKLRW